MKVSANCNVNHNGVWHHTGGVFEISEADAKALGDAVTVISSEIAQDDFDIHAPLFTGTEDAPKRRGRPRKTETENAG